MIRPAHAADSSDAPLWQYAVVGLLTGGVIMAIATAVMVSTGVL